MDTAEKSAPVRIEGPEDRMSLLLPPDWRYQQARTYLSDLRSGASPDIPDDPVVQYLVRGLRCMYCPAGEVSSRFRPGAERYLRTCWPALYEAMIYGMLRRRTAVAAMMDTCLMKGWDRDGAREAGCPVPGDVYDLYALAFFDLTGVRAVHCWIQDYLFEPERHASNGDLLRARLLAYYGEGMSGVSAAVMGKLDKAESELLSKLMTGERTKRLFDYVAGKTKLPPDVYAGIMEAALRSMTEHDFQERMREREASGSESLEELAAHMEEGIRAFSRSELDSCDGSGLDFVNQYTKALIGSKDGKEDFAG